jgi:hypothetical protein
MMKRRFRLQATAPPAQHERLAGVRKQTVGVGAIPDTPAGGEPESID